MSDQSGQEQPHPEQPHTEQTVTVYDGRIVRLEVTDGKWEVVRHKNAVAILALDAEGRMLCVRQTRRAAGGFTLEAPAGLIEDGEDPAAAARRELQEEAGLDGEMQLLTRFYPSPGFCDEELLVFRATQLTESRLPMDEDEDIVVEWHHPAQLLSGLREGSVVGAASTVTAALFALQLTQGGAGQGGAGAQPAAQDAPDDAAGPRRGAGPA